MPPAAGSRSPILGTVSIASRRQSSRPIEASAKRPSLGATSLARAMLMRAARSVPNQGLARALFTGLRVVAIKSVGLAVSSAASMRAPGPASDEHPSSAHADAADARTRNMLRRDTAISRIMILTARPIATQPPSRHAPVLAPDRGNSGAAVRPCREFRAGGWNFGVQRYHAP